MNCALLAFFSPYYYLKLQNNQVIEHFLYTLNLPLLLQSSNSSPFVSLIKTMSLPKTIPIGPHLGYDSQAHHRQKEDKNSK